MAPKAMPLKPIFWPECPAGFDLNGLALVVCTLPMDTPRAVARSLSREMLRELAGRLLDLPSAQIALVEGLHGPILAGTDIQVSLSYAGDKVLIGLSCGPALGVDIVQIDHIAEIDSLSGLYLPKLTCQMVREAVVDVRDEAFALGWAQMEACCKVLSLPLGEIDENRELAYADCELLECEKINGYSMAVALQKKPVHA